MVMAPVAAALMPPAKVPAIVPLLAVEPDRVKFLLPTPVKVTGLLNTSGPEPDPVFDIFYSCAGSLNWDGYCNPEVDRLIDQLSMEAEQNRRHELAWTIERKLAEDVARPIIFYSRGGTCWRPYVKGLTLMVNSIYAGNRREDMWLDK